MKSQKKINSGNGDSSFGKLGMMPQNADIEMITEKDIQIVKKGGSHEGEAYSREPHRSNSFPNFQKITPIDARQARFRFVSRFSENYN